MQFRKIDVTKFKNTVFLESKRMTDSCKNIILFMLLFFLIFVSQTINAQEALRKRFELDEDSTLEIEAITADIRPEEGLIIFTDDVVLKSEKFTLRAQKAIFNDKTKTAEVSGDILLESGEDTLSGQSGVFNYIDQTGVINDARLFIKENHFYFNGNRIEKFGEDNYLIKDFKLTTCDGEVPDWSITGSEIKVTIDGYGSLRNGALRVKDVPLVYVPYLFFPAKIKRQSGVLIPQAGYSGRNGVELEVPVFWAISDSADMTFYERYMTDRGLMQGLEFRNVSGIDSKGSFNLDILSDRIEEKDMNDHDQLELSPFQRTNSARYWFRGRADQQLPMGVRARLDADVVSDQDYLREFESGLTGFDTRPDYESEFRRPVEEFTSPLRTSTLRLSKEMENFSLQAVSSYYQRPEGFRNDTTPEPLAGLDFSMLPGFSDHLPIAFSFASDYDFIFRESGQKGHSLALSPKLLYPLWSGKYLQLETGAGYTRDMQWLENDTGNGAGHQSRDVFYGYARLSTLLERIYDVESRYAKRLKHKIVPALTYEYRSHRDENMYQPWFEAMDEKGSANRVVLSLDNSIDAKTVDEKGNISYSQWGAFRISQGYDIDESRRDFNPEQKKEPFEPLTAELRIMPYSRLNMDAEVQWDHYKDDFSYADVAIRYDMARSNHRTDIYRLDYIYNDDGDKGLSYYVNINLARGFSLGSSLQRDIEVGNDIEKSYWLEYSSQCWTVTFGVQEKDEESRIMLGFRLYGFSD